MSPKTTWIWVLIALGLSLVIFFSHPLAHRPPVGPVRILPNLKADAVSSVQVRPGGTAQLEIRVDRTNHTWQLTEPILYPAQTASIERLLAYLQRLTPAVYIGANEIKNRPSADEDYGFTSPQASVFVQETDSRAQLLIGSHTAPGDQVFLQKVGDQGVYVVDAELLKYIPNSADDWRDTRLVDFEALAFDRIAVTNNGKAFVLQRDSTNQLWQMVWPLGQSRAARADNSLIEESLLKLQESRIGQFLTDEPKDLDTFGLTPPELELALGLGTNTSVLLQFGKSSGDNTNFVYGRRLGQKTVFALSRESLLPWRNSYETFRDPHLLTLTAPVESLLVRGLDHFELRHQTNDSWQVLPQNPPEFPADPDLVKDLLNSLSGMQIIDFVKAVVNAPDLPDYGLAVPARQYVLKASCSDSGSPATNSIIAELSFGFGTNQSDRVFARRTDESSVYAVRTNDFAQLPSASWQMRQRRFWNFSENDVTQVTIHQHGKTRRLIRKGPHEWSLAPGSQGIINDLAVDATVRGLAQLSASAWVARGESSLAAYGLGGGQYQVTLALANNQPVSVEFGREAPSTNVYAVVSLDGQPWVFEFPWILFRDVSLYLSIPPNL